MAEPRRHPMTRLEADRHWTYADYLRLPDDGTRCEILEGERVMTPSPYPPHQIASENLGYLLGAFVRKEKRGRIIHAPSDVILSDDTVVQPDLYFISKERAAIIEDHGVFAPPDLIVEILSESDPKRDTVRKLAIYGKHGVREYWIVDPYGKRVEIFVLEGRELVRKASHDSGKARSLVALPEFSAQLAEIFAK